MSGPVSGLGSWLLPVPASALAGVGVGVGAEVGAEGAPGVVLESVLASALGSGKPAGSTPKPATYRHITSLRLQSVLSTGIVTNAAVLVLYHNTQSATGVGAGVGVGVGVGVGAGAFHEPESELEAMLDLESELEAMLESEPEAMLEWSWSRKPDAGSEAEIFPQ